MSEKNLTGRFRSKLKIKEEEVNTPDNLVKDYNKNRNEDISDFEETSGAMEETLVGKPTGGRRRVVRPVEPIEDSYEEDEIDDEVYSEEEDFTEYENELESDDSMGSYIENFDFEDLARKKQEEEEERRKEEEKRKERLAEQRNRKNRKSNRRSPYGAETFEQKLYTAPTVDLNVTEEHYSTGDRVRTLKPVLSADKQEIEVGTLDIKPLKIGAIRDERGYISARINEIEDKYKIAVLPFDVTGTLPQVEELSEHKILFINGMKYSSGTKRIVNQNKMDCYIENIRRHIERGESFDDTLLERASLDGKVFDTLKFNEMELQMINTLFLEVTAAFYVDASGDVRINVGGYNV